MPSDPPERLPTELAAGLSVLREHQANFDAVHFDGAPDGTTASKRRHIAFHLAILIGKVARVEERLDHGEDDPAIITAEVVPDLLIYAAQLANAFDLDLAAAYSARLAANAHRAAPRLG